ncbi:MAG TPA: flagellar biosynthesis repressor FlbT [Alphaproteobacteria bacterium]|nr:flagellar biosynthesis repressor protein FlbT [Alphaproteobacteria bacterium]HEX4889905.1 flagellar biosynthesis repressor FlbT [Alphaproteobacteria bacterium]
MPLKLSLKPGEKFAVNGAVIVNGDRRGTLVVQNQASILRERDIMQPYDVTTPAKHIYFPIMMMYLDEAGQENYYRDFTARMTEFMDAISRPEVLLLCVEISKEVVSHRYYAALRHCARLLEYEQEILGNEPERVSAHA